MRSRLLVAIVSLVSFAALAPLDARPQFMAVAFHNVIDRSGDGDENAVTVAKLVGFFEWLQANRWTAIGLDDLERARSGTRPLPDRAVLLTFDDGYRSLYTRVYPLLLAYKLPAVAALVGSWMAGPARETARRGDDLIPGSNRLISWDEAREMARSGLVEFVSHSYDLHRSHPANPQGGELPAPDSRAYDPATGYETESAYRQRIRADLERSRDQLQKELGVAPKALAWPFGRYTQAAREEAAAAGYRFLLTLDPEPAFLDDLPIVSRLLPVGDQDLPSMLDTRLAAPPTAVRIVRFDPRTVPATDPSDFDRVLGTVIERLRTLGATTVVVDAAEEGPRGRLAAAWFPNRAIPVRLDVLSRVVWQLRTRAGVRVVLSLPVSAARNTVADDSAVLRLFEDLGDSASADGLLLDDTPALAAIALDRSAGASRWEVRRRRSALDVSRLPPADGLALRAFRAFERARPAARLVLLTPTIAEGPSAVADLTLVEAPLSAKPFASVVNRLSAAGWLQPGHRYSAGVWIRGEKPPLATALAADVRVFQRRGGVAFGWEQDDPLADEPKAALAAPAVSAAVFPLLPKR